ncbi:MAG: hypothetical protein KAV87_24435, partial [Desulfobacteraceae bacterium]|nr:hypothetical protein [Desulfobacteraceae bacterium]
AQERTRLMEIVQNYRPDIVVLCDDEVAHLTGRAINENDIPIFFLGINEDLSEAEWYRRSNKDKIAGLIEWYPIYESIEMFKMMIPIKRIALLSGEGFSSHHITKQFIKELKRANVQISGIYNHSRWDDWKSAVMEINRSSDLVWVLVPYHIYDNDGMEMGVTRIGKWLHDHLSIPSSGITDIHIRVGMFAAISPSTYDLGRESANQIIRYLNGVLLKTIGVTNNRYYDIDINAKTAKKLNIKIPDELIVLANAGRSGKIRDKINTKH